MSLKDTALTKLLTCISENSIDESVDGDNEDNEYGVGYFIAAKVLREKGLYKLLSEIDDDNAREIYENFGNNVYIFDFDKSNIHIFSEDGAKVVNINDKNYGIIYKIADYTFNLTKQDDTMYG
ncbi:MAG: hypothetical protein M1433_03060 [Candidatus Parvarchaeota archaeon]|nr:hypothetical protein [Candidatus Parvarchaeota archaeon]